MAGKKKSPESLRSHRWYGVKDLKSFGHRSRTYQMGYAKDDFHGKPVIAILNTWSDINQCHAHFRERVADIKRGVWASGGFPLELPALSLSEPLVKPSTMLYRNLLAMEAEELLRSHPVDGAVLMGGCDKTTPALIMGAISMDIPAIYFPAGPMLRGNWGGQTLGSGSDVWKYWDEKQAGAISEAQWEDMEMGIARSFGHCMTMGTASTMTAIADSLGFCIPGASSILASDSAHPRMAAACGKRIVDMVWEDLKPSDFLSQASFDNALTVHMALGGSTNAIIHLVAMARRAGFDMSLDRFDERSREVPVLADVRPSGRFLMEDFYYAGGLRALMKELAGELDLSARTVMGGDIAAAIAEAVNYNREVIHPLDQPIGEAAATAILYGNIAPDGAVMKPSAADPRFLKHSGPALVFRDYNHMAAEIDRDELDVTPDSVIVLQNSGPVGGPGMPEWGMLPIPKKLLKQGVRDMLRISDARMSGTSYGACVLHVSPESHIGGPFAAVRTGDFVSVDVEKRALNIDVAEAEIARRLAAFKPPPRAITRGYTVMYADHIQQAHLGCDFDFLLGAKGVPEPEIH